MRESECLWTPTDPRAMEQQCKLQILRVAKDLCTHSHSYTLQHSQKTVVD